MWEDRGPSTHILLACYPDCPNCPRPKVRCFFINLNAPVHFCPGRTYAITRKNKWIAGILYSIVAVQFGLESYMIIWSFLNPGLGFCPVTSTYVRAPGLTKCFPAVVPPVKLPAFQVCSVKGRAAFTIPQVSLSVVFGGYFVTLNHPLHFLRRPTWPFK